METNKYFDSLAELYASYKIYPKSRYTEQTPIGIFEQAPLLQKDHYLIKLANFLDKNNYEPIRRGADLPYWGKEYFLENKGLRIFIIA